MIESSGNYDFLSLCIEAKDKSSVVITPTSFDVGPERRAAFGSNDDGVIYAEIEFETTRCSGTISDVFIPNGFHRLHNALLELLAGRSVQFILGSLEGFFGLEISRDNDGNQVVCRITMPERERTDRVLCYYHDTSSYPGSMRTFVELELWLDESMMQRMLADCEALLERVKELGGGWQ